MENNITREANEIAAKLCSDWGIPHYLHPDDFIFKYGMDRFGIDTAVHSYFHSGRHEAHILKSILEQLCNNKDKVKVLDFASGYGRVARHLCYFSKKSDVYAADIHPEAVKFMRNMLGINSFLSNETPEMAEVGSEYDFVYVLSLFSHLPLNSFVRWLKTLYGKCSPGGYLLFTTHGQASLRNNPPFFEEFYNHELGFGFKGISEQGDLDSATYGTTIVSPGFIFDKLSKELPDALLYSFTSGKWFGTAFQDEYVLQKPI